MIKMFKDLPLFDFADASNTTQTLVVLLKNLDGLLHNVICKIHHQESYLLKSYVLNLDILVLLANKRFSILGFGIEFSLKRL